MSRTTAIVRMRRNFRYLCATTFLMWAHKLIRQDCRTETIIRFAELSEAMGKEP